MNINVKGEPLFNGNCYTTPEIDYIIHTQHRSFDQAFYIQNSSSGSLQKPGQIRNE